MERTIRHYTLNNGVAVVIYWPQPKVNRLTGETVWSPSLSTMMLYGPLGWLTEEN